MNKSSSSRPLQIRPALLVLTIAVAVFYFDSFAGEPSVSESVDSSAFSLEIKNGKVGAPKYLFHWGSVAGLERMANLAGDSERLPLRRMGNGFKGPPIAAIVFPDLFGVPAMFAWSHPTAAMAFSVTSDPRRPGEVYARAKDGQPAALIAMKIKSDVRIKVMNSYGNSTSVDLVRNVDLILHNRTDENGVQFREWILLNPDAVESFTADPRQFPQEIIDEMLASVKEGFTLKPEEQFIVKNSPKPNVAAQVNRAQSAAFRAQIVLELLSTQISIPKIFSGHLGARNSCSSLFK